MIFDLVVFGGVIFWIVVVATTILALGFLESSDEAPVACIIVGVITAILIVACDIPWAIRWWMPVAYLLIGLIWFMFMMTYRLRPLREWIKEDPTRKDLFKDNLVAIPRDLAKIYRTEPCYAKFFDRVLFWPLSMLKFALQDLAKAVYDSLVASLIRYKHYVIGVK